MKIKKNTRSSHSIRKKREQANITSQILPLLFPVGPEVFEHSDSLAMERISRGRLPPSADLPGRVHRLLLHVLQPDLSTRGRALTSSRSRGFFGADSAHGETSQATVHPGPENSKGFEAGSHTRDVHTRGAGKHKP